MELGYFNVSNGIIHLNKYKIIVRDYHTMEKIDYTDSIYFVDNDSAREWEENIIPQHQLLELISKETLDTSAYMWMDGLRLTSDNHADEIKRIATYGSLDAYSASLEETRDAYQMELDYRISKLELGIGEVQL